MDQLLLQSDFMKLDAPYFLHIAYLAISELGGKPRLWDLADAKTFVEKALGVAKRFYTEPKAELNEYLERFALSSSGG
jgi:hypothetical protein